MNNDDLYWVFVDLANGVLSGAMLGGYYALISVGLALNFGVMRLVNLSHGDWLIVAAYLAVAFLSATGVAPFWSLALVVPVMYAVGYVVQRGLLNHVSVQAAERRGMSPVFGLMLPLLVTFGLSIVLSQGMQLVFSSDAVTIKNDLSYSAIKLTDDLSISTLRFGFFIAAAVLLVALSLWLKGTHTGRAIRAASDDPGDRRAHGACARRTSTPVCERRRARVGLDRRRDGRHVALVPAVRRATVPAHGLRRRHPRRPSARSPAASSAASSSASSRVLAGTYFGPAAQQVAGYLLILFHARGAAPRAAGEEVDVIAAECMRAAARERGDDGALRSIHVPRSPAAHRFGGHEFNRPPDARRRKQGPFIDAGMKAFLDSFYGRAGAMWALGLAAVLVLLPLGLDANAYTLHLLFSVFVFAALGHAWNLMAGYAGLLTFGQQVFIGLGGFAQAMVFYYTPASIWLAWPASGIVSLLFAWLLCLPLREAGGKRRVKIGVVVAVVLWGLYEWLIHVHPAADVFGSDYVRRVAILLLIFLGALPLLRLQGAYFAIATWLIAESVQTVFAEWRVVGAGGGMQLKSNVTQMQLYYVALALLAVTTAVIWRWMRSPYGLALTAVRDDEDAARSSGVDVARVKSAVFLVSGAITGLASGLYFMDVVIITPPSAFTISWASTIVFVVVAGGMGTVAGPVIGAIVYIVIDRIVGVAAGQGLLVLGALSIILMLVLPRGFMGIVHDLRFPHARAARCPSGAGAMAPLAARRQCRQRPCRAR